MVQGASQRVLRMLDIVPWIAARDGPRIDEVCERFGVDRRRLVDDLNVLQLVGLPPYTPDVLTEVTLVDDRVWVRLADVFTRPLRLTPHQALGLVAAGQALADAPTSGAGYREGPLGTGLAKLAAVLGIDPAEAVGIHLGESNPGVLQTLGEAVAQRRRVRLDYFSYGRDARNVRDVDPYRVFSESGAWYLYGHCHLAGGPRLFRLDRIVSVDLLSDVFERPAAADETPAVYGPDPDAPRVTLELAPAARWVAEHYPMEEIEELSGGRIRVVMAVSSRSWLERLLLRLGREAQMLEATDPELVDAGPSAARRVLSRYE